MITHAIITMSRHHYLITEEQHNAIKEAGLIDEIEIDGSSIKVSGISEIMKIEKYYLEHPDKRPPENNTKFQDNYGDIGNQQVRKPARRGAMLMKKGFIDHLVVSKGLTVEEAEKRFKKKNIGKV